MRLRVGIEQGMARLGEYPTATFNYLGRDVLEDKGKANKGRE